MYLNLINLNENCYLETETKIAWGYSIIYIKVRANILDSAAIYSYLLVENIRESEVAEKRNDGRKECK